MIAIGRYAAQLGVVGILAFGLTACGGDGVELNGKIFDALGVSTSALQAKPEPKVEQRGPLVLPPDPNRLPEPGSAPPAVARDESWPVDRDQKRMADAAEAKQKQDDWCRDGNWKEKAMHDEAAATAGPSGGCGSIFSAISKGLFGTKQ